MKLKPALINVSFIIYLIGLLSTVGLGMKQGAIIVLVASVLILTVYLIHIVQSIKQKKFWVFKNLTYTVAILVIAFIFVHGYSVSIAMPFLGNIPGFNLLYLVAGLVLIFLFLSASIWSVCKLDKSKKRILLIAIFTVVAAASALGLLGIAGMIPVSGRLITYGLIFLVLFYFVFFIFLLFSSGKEQQSENWILIILSGIVIFFMIARFYFPHLLPQGLMKSIVYFGFVPTIILPISILYIRRNYYFMVFLFYFILLDFYFIHTDQNFNYLIDVGVNGCVGYENAIEYEINIDPGMSVEALLKEPTKEEIVGILKDWEEKDFTPRQIQIEYEREQPNGDSIKVVSHYVNGQKHYGLIRIPKDINVQEAPVLIGLMGGGTGIDILKMGDLYRLSKGNCQQLLDNYISIMPSFRGNILRGEDFCFRSEGYTGDVWLGAAEDAVAFLEVVNFMYNKTDSTKVIATGVSRGATVALIIGGLTDKFDYIIANSTHTKFLDYSVIQNEMVGRSYPRAFYTPKASPEKIRKRILASSPYYFADRLPAFELHQGTEDQKTTVRHARLLEQRLKEVDKNDRDHKIYIYESKGHGYDDDEVVCESLKRFLDN